jgi:hypothetical protein
MSLAAREKPRGRPQLRLVRGAFSPVVSPQAWQKVASAILACTHEMSRHLLEQRWVRLDECLRERRDLLSGLARMPLDADGRRCLLALEQATAESEFAIHSMLSKNRDPR